MSLKIYERKTIGGVTFEIYVNQYKENDNIIKVVDKLNKKEIIYESVLDKYVLKIMRLLNHYRYANGHEIVEIINKKCRKLNIDLSYNNWKLIGDDFNEKVWINRLARSQR